MYALYDLCFTKNETMEKYLYILSGGLMDSVWTFYSFSVDSYLVFT